MRSRAEWAARIAALAALALLLWASLRPVGPAPVAVTARGDLEGALVDATRRPLASLAVDPGSAPAVVHRDWLAAIRAAGTEVAWRARGMTPIAIAAASAAEPESRTRVTVAGSEGTSVVLTDELGAIDTLVGGVGASSRLLRTTRGSLSASAPGARATAPVPPPAQVRRVLVLGSAGWESKFVIAALEEAGWVVDARIRVAPGVETRQGSGLSLDTARHSAVIALDPAALPTAVAIERFVNSGGGAVLAGSATSLGAFARITPGAAGRTRITGARTGVVLQDLKADAVVLERQAAGPLVAVRRAGHGRVLASGYDETWKSRMRPAEAASDSHREWWAALVSAVAYSPPPVARASVAAPDPAPVAALVAALGPPSEPERAESGSLPLMPPAWLLFGVLLATLLGEVMSRRLRGLA